MAASLQEKNLVTFNYAFTDQNGNVIPLTGYDATCTLFLTPPPGNGSIITLTGTVVNATAGTVTYVGYSIPYPGSGWLAQFVATKSSVLTLYGTILSLPTVNANLNG